MENKINKIIEDAKKVSLSSKEKSFIKESLLSHIKSGPILSPFVRKNTSLRHKWYSTEALFSLFYLKPLYIIPVIFLLFLALGGGTSAVAQMALPGDVLYPIKIYLNENLESLVAITLEDDAQVDLKQATRRLMEAEKLKVRGDLTEKQTLEIKGNFEKEVNSLNKNLLKIEKRGDSKSHSEINKEFRKKINEHYKAFLDVSGNSTNTAPFADIIKSKEEYGDNDEDDKSSKKTEIKRELKNNLQMKKDDDVDDGGEGDDDGNEGAKTPVIIKPVSTTTTIDGGASRNIVAKFTLTQVALCNVSTDDYLVNL